MTAVLCPYLSPGWGAHEVRWACWAHVFFRRHFVLPPERGREAVRVVVLVLCMLAYVFVGCAVSLSRV